MGNPMELSQKSDKYTATVITLIFHGLLILLFILYKIIISDVSILSKWE
jgi:hypothetical protein